MQTTTYTQATSSTPFARSLSRFSMKEGTCGCRCQRCSTVACMWANTHVLARAHRREGAGDAKENHLLVLPELVLQNLAFIVGYARAKQVLLGSICAVEPRRHRRSRRTERAAAGKQSPTLSYRPHDHLLSAWVQRNCRSSPSPSPCGLLKLILTGIEWGPSFVCIHQPRGCKATLDFFARL